VLTAVTAPLAVGGRRGRPVEPCRGCLRRRVVADVACFCVGSNIDDRTLDATRSGHIRNESALRILFDGTCGLGACLLADLPGGAGALQTSRALSKILEESTQFRQQSSKFLQQRAEFADLPAGTCDGRAGSDGGGAGGSCGRASPREGRRSERRYPEFDEECQQVGDQA